RIFGDVFYYLMLWSLCITGLVVISVLWTGALLLAPRLRPPAAARGQRAGWAAIVAFMLAIVTLFSYDAAYAQMPLAKFGEALGGVMPPTITALHADRAARSARGHEGRYLVTWVDPIDLGGRGFAFLNELERVGFDVGAFPAYRVAVRDHRVVQPKDAL